MEALSLTQPWATLMAIGAKRYETRDWRTTRRGDIAIAASKGFPRDERELCQEDPFCTVLAEAGITIIGLTPSKPNQLPLGMVVCVVEIVDCIATNPEGVERRLSRRPLVDPAPHEQDFGNYAPDRQVFITTNLRRLRHPVPVERFEGSVVKPGGALGFYTLSNACEAAVRAELVT